MLQYPELVHMWDELVQNLSIVMNSLDSKHGLFEYALGAQLALAWA
jgi:hypothetical protein